MNVTDIASSAATGANATTTQQNQSAGTGKGLDALSDVNAFLTLLVKQLQNQDPLSPQDGSAFAAQLAQFSSLDQLVGINTRLTQLIDAASTPPAAMTPTSAASLSLPATTLSVN